MNKEIILTGVKPTGAPHLGNYVGAIRPAIALTQAAPQSYLFVADYHALNAVRDAKALREDSYQVAATFLALGLDPKRTVFYRQSDIPEIFELSVILSAVTPKGLMDRAHSYKAAKDKNAAEGRDDPDHGVNMGLYTYPLLMAADILVMNATLIPVGKDQVQHIEFARDMAGYFNHAFGEGLVLPKHQIEADAAAIPGLDGRKMSKSYNNHIPVFIEAKAQQKLIMKIITDSKLPHEPKNPDESTIYQLYSQFVARDKAQAMRDAFINGGMGYGDAKKLLAEAVTDVLREPTEKYNALMQDKAMLDDILADGAKRARLVSSETLNRVRDLIGLQKRG